jgi:hypothetical protein
MIERQTVEGRAATVAYLNDKFGPVDKATASLVKVIFDDGAVLFLVPSKAQAQDFNPYHEPGGQEAPRAAATTSDPYLGKVDTGMRPIKAEDFVKARDRSARPGFLSAHPASELVNHKLLTNAKGTVGISVDPQGDIQNVFNFNNGGPKGGAAKAMVAAIANGGRTLDCYDEFLPSYYHQFGFEEVQRMKFNPEFAPKGWDFAKHGTPDIVFMAWHG